uniref:4Fe-4S dicluster domain-containing protein n=1 Tax=Ignavibacterium album TaxID=591197 RepID=A0A832G7M2_9BACT
MYLPKIREIKEALTSFFSKPYTTKFPAEGYKPEEEFRGFPRYHNEDCVGCGTCAQVCPAGAITVTDEIGNKLRRLQINYLSCIHCGQCEEHCITEKGVLLSKEYSFSVMDKNDASILETVEKEILVCEVCGSMIAPLDQLKWIRERLGAKAYAHPNFLLNIQREFFDLEPSYAKLRIRREDQIKEVCPKCRHKIVVEDEFYTFNR